MVLTYRFQTDCLLLRIPSRHDATKIGVATLSPTLVTLAEALLAGTSAVLELEPGEIRSFVRHAREGGTIDEIVFYETVPGGAGYVAEMARRLPEVAEAAAHRLYDHDCVHACYRCLKHYLNQRWHGFFDKDRIRDVLLVLGEQEQVDSQRIDPGGGGAVLQGMIQQRAIEAMSGGSIDPPTSRYRKGAIEEPLAAELGLIASLPAPDRECEIRDTDSGALITVPDFAWEEAKLAVYCDGFAFHGNRDTLELDAQKRNRLQAMGWAVLTFWGRVILRDPARCAREVADLYGSRARNARQ